MTRAKLYRIVQHRYKFWSAGATPLLINDSWTETTIKSVVAASLCRALQIIAADKSAQ